MCAEGEFPFLGLMARPYLCFGAKVSAVVSWAYNFIFTTQFGATQIPNSCVMRKHVHFGAFNNPAGNCLNSGAN